VKRFFFVLLAGRLVTLSTFAEPQKRVEEQLHNAKHHIHKQCRNN